VQPELVLFAQSAESPGASVLVARRIRFARAALVALVWAVSALPAALGIQQCAVATLFHVPCPGCGMTRAIRMLLAGDLAGSLRLHPFAVPVLGAGCLLILATLWATVVTGEPWWVHRTRFGRAALGASALVYMLAAALWVARWFGWFGGPVAVW
jgi:hypothetical protein